MRIWKLFLIFFLIGTLFAFQINAQIKQSKIIKGKITDANTGEAISDASIYLSNTYWGASSNSNGNYEIKNIPSGKYNLIASRLGYKPIIITIDVKTESELRFDLALIPHPIEMNPVMVSENHSAEWEKSLKEFKKYFLGRTSLSDDCIVENEDGLIIKDIDDETMEVSCREPLIIINKALGFRIECQLQRFVKNKTSIDILYYPKFTDLEPSNYSELSKWKERRKEVYISSIKRFLKSLIEDKTTGEGYRLKFNKAYPNILSYGSSWKYDIIKYNKNKGTYNLEFHKYLEIYNDNSDELSWLYLPNGKAEIDKNGILINPLEISVSGDLAKNGIANLLPISYFVNSSE